MAKKQNSISLKGDYYHQKQVIAEYDKKTEETTYYSLVDLLSGFDMKNIKISIVEEDAVPSVEQPFDDNDE